ncbi:MAG: helix-turn-helix transcriptional regulator [Actinobacteria bacterium]|nr:helix-turn-helix transcriptional regulator [Actinomycetota bacterium]
MADDRKAHDPRETRRRSSLLVSRSHLGPARISPVVVARLADVARGDDQSIRNLADTLSESQLRGRSLLPDTMTGSPDHALGDLPPSLSPAERRALVAASVLVDDRVQTLLAASGVDVRVLRNDRLRDLIPLRNGRFERVSENVRAAVLTVTTPEELRDVHRAAARTLTAEGDPRASWHLAAVTTAPDGRLAKHLILFAQNLYQAGNCEAAVRVAGRAVMLSDSEECTATASRIAGLASFWGGWLDDADTWFRRCAQLHLPVMTDEGTSAARILARIRRGTEPDPDPKGPAHRFVGMISGLHPPHADLSALDGLRRLIAVYVADRAAADEMLAALLLSVNFVSPQWPWDDRPTGALTPLTSAHLRSTEVAFQAQAGDFPRAAATLLWAAARFPLELVAWGIVGSISREIAQHSDALDPALASIFADLSPSDSLVWMIEGRPAGRITIDAVPPPQESSRHPIGASAVDLADRHLAVELTRREKDVLLYASGGSSVQIIANELGISPRTAEVHLGNIYRKLGVSSRPQLMALLHRWATHS